MNISTMFSLAVTCWAMGFLITRMYVLHLAYNKRAVGLKNNLWLQQQCQSHEFYHNMKHHSNVCEEVDSRSSESIFLGAVADTIEQTYLCGYEPCEAVIDRALTWVVGKGIVVIAGVTLALLVFVLALVPIARAYQRFCYRNKHLYLRSDPYVDYYSNSLIEPAEVRCLRA